LARSKPVEVRQAEVAKALEPLLKVVDDQLAAAATGALGRWATADNLPALTAALESQSVVVRWAALDAIGYFPSAKTAEATAKHLCLGPDRLKASQALQLMGPKAETAVASYLSNADNGVRLEACRILKMIGTPASVAALRKAADGSDTVLAQAADDALRAVRGR
jgi:HEAT repeat protein